MTIVSDFRKITSQKKGIYQLATITLQLPDTAAITEEVQLYARGEFRRQNCNMPGLMINFKTTTSLKLSGLKRLKLVCGCGSSVYEEQLLLTEYLIYKMYNLLTDMSFRPRLVKVHYKDAHGKTREYTQYAFFIEDVDDLAARNGCREAPARKYLTEETARSQMTLVAMFQYMIGNTDWAVPNNHNIKLIRPAVDSTSPPFVVPYDFDFAGMVNAPYAIPHEGLGIEKVTDRLYRGFPRTIEELDIVIQKFMAQRGTFVSLINNFTLIDKKDRQVLLKYMDDFYEIISNKRRIKEIFIDNARRS